MEQKSIFKSSIWKVFEIFVDEPLKIHYIKEISKKISLAPTSVKNHLNELEKEKIIIRRKGERFIGYLANRDDNTFLFYKKIFNLMKIKESGILKDIKDSLYPKAIILYGSYNKGEDIEKSDIDLFVISESKKDFDFERYEKTLKRNIHLIIEKDINKLNENLKLEILNGLVLDGYLKYGR